jgi:hypothetical protein
MILKRGASDYPPAIDHNTADGANITKAEWVNLAWWENLGFTASVFTGRLPLPDVLP